MCHVEDLWIVTAGFSSLDDYSLTINSLVALSQMFLANKCAKKKRRHSVFLGDSSLESSCMSKAVNAL